MDTSTRPSFGTVLALLVLAALALSVGYTLVSKGNDDNLLDEGDAFYYGLTAANAANGNWFQDPFTLRPAADHPPLTVIALVPTSRLFDGPLAQRLTMSVIGALTVGAVGLAGREIAGARVGLVAAAIALVNPNLWINNARRDERGSCWPPLRAAAAGRLSTGATPVDRSLRVGGCVVRSARADAGRDRDLPRLHRRAARDRRTRTRLERTAPTHRHCRAVPGRRRRTLEHMGTQSVRAAGARVDERRADARGREL